ncbi:MAG: hypothetical protein V2J24_16100 [Pseudomonadales bacterium]|jgi:hypothetical protein|nr:hypothetical protein [Pseudomonadales bacterium]
MNDWSFNEKSLVATILAQVLTATFYFEEVRAMLASGNRDVGDIAVVAIIAVILLIVIEAGYHAVMAARGDVETDDERDQGVRLRGSALQRRLLEIGVITVIGHIAFGSLFAPERVDLFLIGNLLLAVLVAAELAARGFELWLYRRGF